jgi:uncharacterized protein (DUF2236 family)
MAIHPPANESEFSRVTPAGSEALIASVMQATPDVRAGIFGPGSMSWKINREAGMFLGAGRAALLQLAHPWVATAIAQHSSVLSNPIARFHNTFRVVFAMVFGSLDQAVSATRYLYRLHTRVQGQLTETVPGYVPAYAPGSRYEANEIAALRWVYATLIETAVLAYETVVPPLSDTELHAYYRETKLLAALFGLPSSALPHDWTAFLAYCRAMEQSTTLGVTPTARSIGHSVLAGAGSWIKPPHWYRALTTAWLPERLRSEFELPYQRREARSVQRARSWLPRVYRQLPASLRFVGPWHEAQSRLAGHDPGPFARVSNRFWIGEPRVPFGAPD